MFLCVDSLSKFELSNINDVYFGVDSARDTIGSWWVFAKCYWFNAVCVWTEQPSNFTSLDVWIKHAALEISGNTERLLMVQCENIYCRFMELNCLVLWLL